LFRHRRAGPERGQDLQVTLELPLEAIRRGGEETVRYIRPNRLPTLPGERRRARRLAPARRATAPAARPSPVARSAVRRASVFSRSCVARTAVGEARSSTNRAGNAAAKAR
jgi:hypothetical protein